MLAALNNHCQSTRILKNQTVGSKWMSSEPELAYVALSVVCALWQEATTDMLRQLPEFWASVFQVCSRM